jgi:phosphonate transport system permease protein
VALRRPAGRDATGQGPDQPVRRGFYRDGSPPLTFLPRSAYGLYRREIVVRDSAIFGILGVATSGYHVDDAMS